MKQFLILLMCLILTGCQSPSTSKPEVIGQTKPTLTEKMAQATPNPMVKSLPMFEEVLNKMATMSYDWQANLKSNSGGETTGVVKAVFAEDTYALTAEFEQLMELKDGYFYEGWLVRNEPIGVISTGKVVYNMGKAVNNFASAGDLTDHKIYILTLEADDGNPAPGGHVLEGTFEKIAN